MLANLLRRSSGESRADSSGESRADSSGMSLNDYLRRLQTFSFNGQSYTIGGSSLEDLAEQMVAGNAAVAAVTGFRMSVFSEATFKFQNYSGSKPGVLFGDRSLGLLENPWPGAGTEHLLAAMEIDVTVYGNSYWIVSQGQLVRLDPCHVNVATVEVVDPISGIEVGERLVGYTYKESKDKAMAVFLPDEVAHYYTKPDPECMFRGVSWLRAVLSDAQVDDKMTGYKQALLDNSAVPGMVLRAEPGISIEQITEAREALKARNTGWDKVGRTLILGAGFDPVTVGQNMQQLDMKSLQGAGESRIAAAGGVSPVLVGFSEGLQGSSLNSGNYGSARRRFADGTVRPMWRAACTALSTLVPPPVGARLWFDDTQVSFLQEDVLDAAEIMSREALTIEALIRAGWNPDSARDSVLSKDFSKLSHTGLYSVQLQPPGSGQPAPPARAEVPVVETRSEQAPLQQQFTFHIDSRAETPETQVQVDVHVPEQRAEQPIVNVTTPAPVVQNTVNVEPTPIQVDARTTVEAPNVTVKNDVKPAPVTVIEGDGPSRKSVKFTKDGQGRITGATVIEE